MLLNLMDIIDRKLLTLILLLGAGLMSHAGAQVAATACRVDHHPQGDGLARDTIWQSCAVLEGFRTYRPFHNRSASFPTQVRIAYDDKGIYVLAEMQDPRPDSILKQLGNRDDELNADYFGIAFDTYDNQGDAYFFQVTASGVQSDYRRSDPTYDAVWKSAVGIHEQGWVAELYIPYSALRFPSGAEQEWGLQIYRYIRRYRELSQWSLENKGSTNELAYWGKLVGLHGIDAPLRLSLTPFAGLVHEYQPGYGNQSRMVNTSFTGGLDLKLGLSEAFTLDVTLLPDFSQVRSDNFIKNLSAYETVYDENRPFFSEGVDLFKRGDIFYSRRIGREPGGRARLGSTLQAGDEIMENPDRVKLINALKVSGRNKHGLALGIFNAITGQAIAWIRDSLDNQREVITEPLANYNIVVIDKQFRGSTSAYLINTNVLRNGHGRDANVTAGGFTLADPSSTYEIRAYGALSQVYLPGELGTKDPGFRYKLELARVKGNIHFKLLHGRISKDHDINDMGLIHRRGLEENNAQLSYRLYEPFGPFMEMRNTIDYYQTINLRDRSNENTNINYSGYTALRNYLSIWWGANLSPLDRHDYYEARTPDRVFIRPGYLNGNFGFSSDYRKPFALDGRIYRARDFDTYRETTGNLSPILRANDRLSLNIDFRYSRHDGVKGYVSKLENSDILIGERSMNTYVGTVNARYMFMADMSLSLWVRHYWQEGWYDKFFTLAEAGYLYPFAYGYKGQHDYSFNSFNVDVVWSWVFAPGSLISIAWKQALLEDRNELVVNYFENIRNVMDKPHAGLWSVRFVYYLDYSALLPIKQS